MNLLARETLRCNTQTHYTRNAVVTLSQTAPLTISQCAISVTDNGTTSLHNIDTLHNRAC